MGSIPVDGFPRRALLSVTDKTGLDLLAPALYEAGYQLIASGGTAAFLRDLGLPVVMVADLTGYPEIFGGRVKTLHPAIHGGILGPRVDDFADVREMGITPIDVVVVNLYRFNEAVAELDDPAAVIEHIDIGGPSLLRSAAKNHARVAVLSHPDQYEVFLEEMAANEGGTTPSFRRDLAAAAFGATARYDTDIARWFGDREQEGIHLRYGENPHQAAVMHIDLPGGDLAALGLVRHGGKELSYNNIVDLVAGLKLVADFDEPCCAALKHTNPCGFGLGAGAEGLERALKCDPVSAFGGVFVFGDELDLAAAEILAGRFLEIVAAPAYAPAALELLLKKKNRRVLTVDFSRFQAVTGDKRRAWGALELRQDEDAGFSELDRWQVVAGPEPDPGTAHTLAMIWKVCKHGKSNAIVLGNAEGTLGLGFGQMSRIDSTELAVMKAGQQGLDLQGCCAASDGFFPFPDGIERLAAAGVRAVIAPGGSIRDKEVAAAADTLGLTLVFTDHRHFNH